MSAEPVPFNVFRFLSGIVVRISAVLLSERPGLGTAVQSFLEGASHYWPAGPWEVRVVASDGDGFEVEVQTNEDVESLGRGGALALDAALSYVQDEATAAVDRMVYR